MKICFVTLPQNIANQKPSKSLFRSPPITHLWLAAILKNCGQSVSILDAASLQMDEQQILQAIQIDSPDIVGFTVFTNAFYDVMYMARRIKEELSNVRVAVGGYHVNSLPEDFYSECIDYIFAGEAEYELVRLMERLDIGDESKDGILGLHYFKEVDDQWVVNPPLGFNMDFDGMPLLPYEMITDNGYTTWWTSIDSKREKYMATITGKGCPMNCSFCDISKTEGFRYRAMSAERVLDELVYLSDLGITHVEFRDPFFTVNLKRVERIAQGIIDKKLNIEWGCSSTVKVIRDPAFLNLLYDSGCRFIFYGVESGNPEILKREKKVSPDDVLRVVKMTQEAGIQAHCSFIFGLEGETEQSMQQTVDLALSANPNTASFSIAVPYPGTQIYFSYLEKGYIKTKDWRLYDGGQSVFETESISNEMLVKKMMSAHRVFYFRSSYIFMRLRMVRSFGEFKNMLSIALNMLFDVGSYKR